MSTFISTEKFGDLLKASADKKCKKPPTVSNWNYCVNKPDCCYWPNNTSPQNPPQAGQPGPIPSGHLVSILRSPELLRIGAIKQVNGGFELLDEHEVVDLLTQYSTLVTVDREQDPLTFHQEQIRFFETNGLQFQKAAAMRALRTHLTREINNFNRGMRGGGPKE